MKIPLAGGNVAIIDNEDYGLVRVFSWHESRRKTVSYASCYAGGGRENTRRIYLHRLVMGFPECNVDHINHNGLDCRKENLRLASVQQNRMNQRKWNGTKSAYKGVRPRGKKWEAYITIDRKYVHLGSFKTEKDAAEAYNRSARMNFMTFAMLNDLTKC